MLAKGSKLFSIFSFRCPRCHEGKFLKNKIYDYRHFTSVRKSCEVCQQNFIIEPSFYYGSMYVAYALGVALMVAIITLNYLFFAEFSFLRAFGGIVIAMLIFSPLINALSKIIWANLFISFDQKFHKRKNRNPRPFFLL